MKISRITAFAGIAAIVLAAAAPGFAQQGGASCSQEIAQVRAHIWRAQAAMDIAHIPGTQEPASGAGRGKSLASATNEPDKPGSGVGRIPGTDQPASGASRIPGTDQPASGASRGKSLASATNEPDKPGSGVGRIPGTDQPASGASRIPGTDQPGSGVGRALAAAPGFTPASSAGRVSKTSNAQFRVLGSDQDRKAFLVTLNEQERSILYTSLSPREKNMFTTAMGVKGVPAASDQDAKSWAGKIATDRTALSKNVAKARALAIQADKLCRSGDAAGASAKAKEAMDVLK